MWCYGHELLNFPVCNIILIKSERPLEGKPLQDESTLMMHDILYLRTYSYKEFYDELVKSESEGRYKTYSYVSSIWDESERERHVYD